MLSHNLKLTIHFFNQEPIAAARKVEALEPSDAAELLSRVPFDSAANVLKSMFPSPAAKILVHLPEDYNGGLFQQFELADLASILRYVSRRRRYKLLELLSIHKQTLCKLLISYPEDSVGSLVETDLLIFDSHMTVADALLRVKKHNFSTTSEIFVTNANRSLLGSVMLHDLIKKPTNTIIKTICKENIDTVSGYSDVSAIIDSDIWLKTDIVAVTNRKNEVIGILRHCNIRNSLSRINHVKAEPETISEEIFAAYASALSAVMDLFTPVKKTN